MFLGRDGYDVVRDPSSGDLIYNDSWHVRDMGLFSSKKGLVLLFGSCRAGANQSLKHGTEGCQSEGITKVWSKP
jgi:hypothetical protein